MSMALIATSLGRNLRVERGPTGDVQRLVCPVAAYDQLLPGARQRIYDLVIQHGVEAWTEAGDIVFHRARFPLSTRRASDAHARRMAFLLRDDLGDDGYRIPYAGQDARP